MKYRFKSVEPEPMQMVRVGANEVSENFIGNNNQGIEKCAEVDSYVLDGEYDLGDVYVMVGTL